jgi:hypothetical protein
MLPGLLSCAAAQNAATNTTAKVTDAYLNDLIFPPEI